MVRCIRAVYGRPGVLATWTQEPVCVPYGFRKVHIQVPYDQSCVSTSGLYEASESPSDADRIQLTCRPRDERIWSPHACSGSFTAQNRRKPVSGSCESLTFGAPTGPQFCTHKNFADLYGIPNDFTGVLHVIFI